MAKIDVNTVHGPEGAALNHLVLEVHDTGESETFLTETLGFERVGILEREPNRRRFFAAKGGGPPSPLDRDGVAGERSPSGR